MALRTPLSVTPHLYMGDSTGRPLDMGTVYFGEPDKDPEFYPIELFSDDALTLPLAQPVHTKGGYLYDKGDMVEPHAKELIYSVKVLDSYGRKVFYKGAMMRNSWNDDVIEQISAALVSTAEQSAQIATDVAKEIADKAVVSSGFVTIDSFEAGATITQRNQALRHAADGKLYRWAGDLPKVVSSGSVPLTSGGLGANAWLEVSDTVLRQELTTSSNLDGGAYLVKNAVIAASSVDTIKMSALRVGTTINLTQGGRSGLFEVVAGDFSSLVAEDTFNTLYIPLADDPLGGSKVAMRMYSGGVNILWTGAKSGDDITSELQSLFDIANKTLSLIDKYRNFAIYIPNGHYTISDMIYSEDWYNFIMYGDGKAYSSRIGVSDSVSEDTPLEAMFRCGSGFTSNIVVKAITLDAQNRAKSIIDLTNGGLRDYSASQLIVKECVFTGIRKGGYGIEGVTWISVIDSVVFRGYGSTFDTMTGHQHGTGLSITGASNGIWVYNCYFIGMEYGIESTSGSMEMVSIRDNGFENLNKYAIKSSSRVSQLIVEGNYFERVGASTSWDDIPHVGGSTNVSSLMVFAENPDSPDRTDVSSLSIHNNLIISCFSESVLAISRYNKVSFKGNKVRYKGAMDSGTKYNEAVRSFGSSNIRSKYYGTRLHISGNDYIANTTSDVFGVSIEKVFTGLDNPDKGVVIEDNIQFSKTLPPEFDLDNHLSWLNTKTVGYTAHYKDTTKQTIILNKVGSSSIPELDLEQYLPAMQGNYLRFEVRVKAAVESEVATHIRLRVTTGVGVSVETISYPNKEAIPVGGCFYIPPNATQLKVAISSLTADASLEFESIQICPANLDLSAGAGGEKILMPSAPTVGAWVKGDTVHTSSPTAGGYMGWACVESGTPGTWKGFGLIEA